MEIGDKIIDEKLQYDMKREAATIAELLSGETDKHKYLTGVVILPPDQRRMIEKAMFTSYFFRKKLWKTN